MKILVLKRNALWINILYNDNHNDKKRTLLRLFNVARVIYSWGRDFPLIRGIPGTAGSGLHTHMTDCAKA